MSLRLLSRAPLHRPALAIRRVATANNASAGAGTDAANAISTPLEKKEEKPAVQKDEDKQGYQYGTFHWTLERASAIALIPLFSTQLIYGAHPICDGLLGMVVPYHCYLGFDACITDYIQKRNYPRMNRFANWTNFGLTGLVMWGCFEFNTNEIGLTEFIQRMWTA
ncbi:CybS-domain-containing protein [Fennellomyces sp. T-0311]|nr:CybS-domain-containing protein [Fennellomyces sp. T-0311]